MPKLTSHKISRSLSIYLFPALLALALLLNSCGGKTPVIRADITGLPDSEIYLNIYDEGIVRLDSTTSENGTFRFTLPDILPNVLFIQFGDFPDFYLPVIAEGKSVHIEGDFNRHNDIIVKGTPANDALYQYRTNVKEHNIKLLAINMGLSEYKDSMLVENMDLYESLLNKRDSVQNLILSEQKNFIRENPSNIVSAMFCVWALTDSTSIYQIEELLRELDTEAMPDNAFLRQLYRHRDIARKENDNYPVSFGKS